MTHTPLNLYTPEEQKEISSFIDDNDQKRAQLKDHLVFSDLTAYAEARCTIEGCYKLISINYGQTVQLWPQIDSVKDAVNMASRVVAEQVQSYATKLEDKASLETDGDIRVVNISKQFWLDNLTDLETDSELHKALEAKGEGKALLVYKTNDYIKLVPYLQTKKKPDINKVLLSSNKKRDDASKEDILKKAKQKSLDSQLSNLDKQSDTEFSFKLFPKQTIQLLDSEACSSILEDQELLLVRFVQAEHAQDNIQLNSFVIITKKQISVFDPDKHEIARISNILIGSAILLDSTYIYIMEERHGTCFEQYADKESEWELSEPKEIARNCAKEEEGCIAINFQALFK